MGEEELLLESTGRRRLGAAFALIALAAVVALGIGVAAVSKGAADAGKPTPTGTPEILVLAHFDADGLAFDYPAPWTVVHSGYVSHYLTILDYLGTASELQTIKGLPDCPPDLDFDGSRRTERCGSDLSVGAGQILLQFGRADGPPRPGPIDPNDSTMPLDPGSRYVTVGGLPAIYTETKGADSLTLRWMLSVPARLIPRFDLEARIVGPGIERMRAQVEALVASIRYDPPAPALVAADGPRMAGLALAQLRKNDASFGCFPTTPGQSAHAIVSQLPGYATLSKALPVTCQTAIEPNDLGLWKLTLTQSWAAASDRQAGSLATTIWVSADGDPGMQTSGPADVPYLGAGPT